MFRRWLPGLRPVALIALVSVAVAPVALAGEWTAWRGPDSTGASSETGLVENWSPEGENLLWSADIISRSTPVVVDGRVCANGRVGDGVDRQERVACFDASTGKLLWEDRFNVYNTTVPFNRVGWASMAADSETGNVYAHGVAGQLNCYSPTGKKLWSRFLTEEIGHLSGYGGRTQTPIVDGDQLLMSFVSSSWGPTAAFRHRMYSFDKRTGELNWVATPGGLPKDANTQSAPVLAEINGQQAVVFGNSDGSIYALNRRTGETIWKFKLSKRGINSTVVIADGMVFASHSEENLDDPTMGRVVAFPANGTGDITESEAWRINELASGFPSPSYADGMLYVVDNSANLHAIDAKSGTEKWQFELGTVGKSSPVVADGKIYAPETNGNFHILQPGPDGAKALDHDEVEIPEGGRYAEIYGSVAVADGRIFLPTEGKLYAIGKKGATPAGKKSRRKSVKPKKGSGPVASLQVRPTEVVLAPGETGKFVAHGFNAKGESLGEQTVEWTLAGLPGTVQGKKGATYAPGDGRAARGGKVVAKMGDVEAFAAVRVIPPLPWSEDFESYDADAAPPTWVGAPGKYKVVELDGNNVLAKIARPRGLLRTALYMGPSDWTDYQFEIDLRGNNKRRRLTDLGVIASGYTIDLMGNNQVLQVRSWPSENRMMKEVDFTWEPHVWYSMKAQVQQKSGKAHIRAKVWKKGEAEPADWTLVVEDPIPIEGGSPGLVGYSPADVYYDNIRVTEIR